MSYDSVESPAVPDLTEELRRRLRRLWFSEIDFKQAEAMFRLLKERMEARNIYGMAEHYFEIEGGLLAAGVVAYGRPFSKNWGGEIMERSLESLDLLADAPERARKMHELLMDLRNQLFAHSDGKALDPVLLVGEGGETGAEINARWIGRDVVWGGLDLAQHLRGLVLEKRLKLQGSLPSGTRI